MAEMLKEFVSNELEKQVNEKYPHIKNPPCMYAKVINVMEKGDLFSYTLKILDKNMEVNNDFPEVPNVKSVLQLNSGDIAVIVLLYGGSDIFILGRCVS